ncbi:MAG: patatin-like phospholipase family protein [Elusimicrobia bacterium]|nr:patatin-like phospholipase family protein [Elusimicrobiota bacterium]
MKVPLEFLASTELFRAVDASALTEVIRELEAVRLAGGDVLFREGDEADYLYLVVTGRLRASISREGKSPRTVGEAGRGEVVGEIALLTNTPRSATVRAIRDAELLRLSRAGFDSLVEKHPRTMMPLLRRIVLRDQEALRGKRRFEVPKTIAVVPATTDVSAGAFADRLEKALNKSGPTLRLDEETGKGRTSTWFNEEEAKNDFLLYVAGTGPSAWTDMCLRQADIVLLVVPGDRAPDANEALRVRELSKRTHGRVEVVLVHGTKSLRYPGSGLWTGLRPADRRHHVVLELAGDFERLVRILTGKALGLVLGGGGARGFAHIGVLRALEEEGVVPDMIGGTSMGSFISAQYALGLGWQEMRDFNARFWNEVKPYSDYTSPMLALVRGRRYESVARELFGDTRIEDLWIDYFCVASSLTRAEIHVPSEGSLLRWVGASMSVPGILPPLFDGGELYVDGGVLDNVPVDVMRGRCDGPVIAVDVTPRVDLATDPACTERPSPWDLLWSRVNPYAAKIDSPSMFSILGRTTALSCVRMVETMKRDASLYLHPPIEKYGMLDFKRIDPIMDIGYQYAKSRIAEWKAGRH